MTTFAIQRPVPCRRHDRLSACLIVIPPINRYEQNAAAPCAHGAHDAHHAHVAPDIVLAHVARCALSCDELSRTCKAVAHDVANGTAQVDHVARDNAVCSSAALRNNQGYCPKVSARIRSRINAPQRRMRIDALTDLVPRRGSNHLGLRGTARTH
jgi:hypothetical protein